MSATTTTYTVAVFSTMRGSGWQGQVPTIDLEELFRYFNRVDDADGPRLDAIGYDLPPMTSGDLVALIHPMSGSATWYLCASSGWAEITDAQAQAYMILAQNASRAHQRPPMFTKLKQFGTLCTLTDAGEVAIAPTGRITVAA